MKGGGPYDPPPMREELPADYFRNFAERFTRDGVEGLDDLELAGWQGFTDEDVVHEVMVFLHDGSPAGPLYFGR